MELDPAAEKKLRRKIDMMIVPTVALLYLFCFIDRANIGKPSLHHSKTCRRVQVTDREPGNARLAGLEKDLGLVKNDYNALLSVFYISYILFEIPANILCKWMGPGWFIPLTSLGFGISSIGTAFVHTEAQASGVRFVLGIFEAGMLPGIAYYMSRWYRRSELAFRLAMCMYLPPT